MCVCMSIYLCVCTNDGWETFKFRTGVVDSCDPPEPDSNPLEKKQVTSD